MSAIKSCGYLNIIVCYLTSVVCRYQIPIRWSRHWQEALYLSSYELSCSPRNPRSKSGRWASRTRWTKSSRTSCSTGRSTICRSTCTRPRTRRTTDWRWRRRSRRNRMRRRRQDAAIAVTMATTNHHVRPRQGFRYRWFRCLLSRSRVLRNRLTGGRARKVTTTSRSARRQHPATPHTPRSLLNTSASTRKPRTTNRQWTWSSICRTNTRRRGWKSGRTSTTKKWREIWLTRSITERCSLWDG